MTDETPMDEKTLSMMKYDAERFPGEKFSAFQVLDLIAEIERLKREQRPKIAKRGVPTPDSPDLPPQVGDVWRNLDTHNPTEVRVVYVSPTVKRNLSYGRVEVTGLDGKRRRSLSVKVFRSNDSYRSGYTLISRKN